MSSVSAADVAATHEAPLTLERHGIDLGGALLDRAVVGIAQWLPRPGDAAGNLATALGGGGARPRSAST